MRIIGLILAGAVLLSGCVKREPLVSSPQLTVFEQAVLPTPNRADLVAADRASFIGPLDTLAIEVFNTPELTRDVQVDLSGSISIPLVGTIDARGKTREELAGTIDTALRGRYIRDPIVTVNIKDSVSQVVTVDGQVTAPGLYPVTTQTTLMRAIAAAKGLSEFARLEDVVVLRTVNSQRMAGLYNLNAIRRGQYGDPAIYANDVVIVGDSPQRRMFKDFLAVSPLLASPIVALLQR